MTKGKYFLIVLLALLASACADSGQPVKSLPDNPENRAVVAKKYLEAMPPKEMLQHLTARVAPNLPEKERKVFTDTMTSEAMENAAYRITLDALVKHFTVGELNVMAAFYGSPEGQSAYKKFDPYMREVITQIQGEVKKALPEMLKPPPQGQPQAPKAQPEAQKVPPAPPAPQQEKAPPSKK